MAESTPKNEILSRLLPRQAAGKSAIILVIHAGNEPPDALLNSVEDDLVQKGRKVLRVNLTELAPNPVAELVALRKENHTDIFSILFDIETLGANASNVISALNIHRNTYAKRGVRAIFWTPILAMPLFGKYASNFLDFRTRVIEVGFDGSPIPKTVEEFGERIRRSETPRQVLAVLDQAIGVLSHEKERDKKNDFVGATAFQTLQRLTKDSPGKAALLILEHLLPICIQKKSDKTIWSNSTRAQELLVEWINQPPFTYSNELRDQVMEPILEALDAPDPTEAIRTLAAIGFRNTRIVKKLWKFVETRDDEIGDLALTTRVFLGVWGDEKEKCLKEVHRRTALRYNHSLLNAIRGLAAARSIEPVFSNWLLSEKLIPGEIDFGRVLQVVAAIADEDPDNSKLQDKAWSAIHSALEKTTQDGAKRFLSGFGAIAPHCNTPRVVFDLLALLMDESLSPDASAHLCYLIQLRLAECIRPFQLTAWENAQSDPLLQILKSKACKDTQDPGEWRTLDMHHKESAWETLFRLGCVQALEWFDPAVEKETNFHFRATISKFFACFKSGELPESLVCRVMEEYDLGKEVDSSRWVYHDAVIDIVWSASSMQAFQALLKFGLTNNGEVTLKVANALSEVSVILTKSGSRTVPHTLMQIMAKGPGKRHRIAAAAAIKHMAREGVLPGELIPDLSEIMMDPTCDEYQRALIANIFGFLPKKALTPRILQALRDICDNKDERIAAHALEALARQDCLIEFEDILSSGIGLRKTGNQWRIEPKFAMSKWAPYFTAWLHHYHPDRFTAAIIDILASHSWDYAVQILGFWDSEIEKAPDLTEEMQATLVQRVKSRESDIYSEKEIFHYLAVFAPDRLALEKWEVHWINWRLEAREALAKALGEAVLNKPESKNRVVALLIQGLEDESYAIRRTSYRSLSIQYPDSLKAWVETFSRQNAPIEKRNRAAEACHWLADQDSKHFHGAMIHDPELSVRRTVGRARKEGRNRTWANACLRRILKMDDFSNQNIMKEWPYGKALARIGDDRCIDDLSGFIQKRELPPNVKFWIKQIIDEMKGNWRKTIQAWPNAWVSYKGKVNEGKGFIITREQEEFPVNYTIWDLPPSTPLEYHEWRGVAFPEKVSSLDLMFDSPELELRLENNRRGKIIAVQVQGKMLTFKNQGAFPTPG